MILTNLFLAFDAGFPIEILAFGLIVLIIVIVLLIGAIALTIYLIKHKFSANSVKK